ncbi:alpha/beta hydrolase [Bradyrhizobium sp. 14AA]
MTETDPLFNTFEYFDGQLRNTHPPLLASFEGRSEASVKTHKGLLDIDYGSHPRQKLDIFLSPGPARGAILYFHPGYWQSRDKSTFRFLADSFVPLGYDFILANYPLCPDVTLGSLVEHVAASVPFALNCLVERAYTNGGLIVAGHSAGGHLAVEMALRAWPATLCNGRPVRKVMAISGVYQLTPLVCTPVNDKLQLNYEEARANSPIHRASEVGVPAIFVVGGDETSEFRRQSRDMRDAWKRAGNAATYVEVPGADHFSVVSDLASTQIPTLLASFGP